MSTREAFPWQPSPSGGYGAATAVVPVQRTDRPERDVDGQPASPKPLAIRSASTRLLAPLVGVLALALAHARCMRQHGINTPDPKITADGPELRYPRGVDPDDPTLKAAERACQRYLPDMLGP
jgi:hypothetical protein